MGWSKVVFNKIGDLEIAVINRQGQEEIERMDLHKDAVLINMAEEIHNDAWVKTYNKNVPHDVCKINDKSLLYFKDDKTNYYHVNWFDSQDYDSGSVNYFCKEPGDFTILNEFIKLIEKDVLTKKKVIINCVYGMSRSFTFSLILRMHFKINIKNSFEETFNDHYEIFHQCGPTDSLKGVSKEYYNYLNT
jgi:hypothetical protein